MIRPEIARTCADCDTDLNPDNEGPCVRDWRCHDCWAVCTRCRGDECGHEGEA